MATFPLHKRPTQSYHENPRKFGSGRDAGKRKHAGCDLYAPVGTPIVAMEDGVVVQTYLFYCGTYALEVKHASGFIARYGEIQKCSLKAGDVVKEGQVIATVGKLEGMTISMLHLELFSGVATGPLTVRGVPGGPFSRRSDLIDPTGYLDALTATQS